MNKWEKEVQQSLLTSEKQAIKRLDLIYTEVCESAMQKANELAKQEKFLLGLANQAVTEEEKKNLLSMAQSKAYQKRLQVHISDIADSATSNIIFNSYQTIEDYLKDSYTDAYVGQMYNIMKQGIPIITPMNQEKVTRAILINSKVSEGLYTKLGVDVDKLKKNITMELARGFASLDSYDNIARNLENRVKIPRNNANRIVRTEGHRIQQQSMFDASQEAKNIGCDVVKQWDSVLDDRTREEHQKLDGQIAEIDEEFEVDGMTAMFPSDFNIASMDINCRCVCNTRAKWALGQDELQILKDRADYFGIDKTDSFKEFEDKYINAVNQIQQAQQQVQATNQVVAKKEYLTEKKLKEKLSDADTQLADLKNQFEAKYLQSYENVMNNSKDIQNHIKSSEVLGLIDSSTAKEVSMLAKNIENLEKDKKIWQDKLDKKLSANVAKQAKKENALLQKENAVLQQEINQINIKTYSGIWKSDVTTNDWILKQDSVQKKLDYYKNKIAVATDTAEIAKYNDLIAQVKEFDAEGKKLADLKSKLNANNAKIAGNTAKTSSKATNVANNPFTDERRRNAKWFKKFSDADNYFDPPAITIHKSATTAEHKGFYTYTQASGGHNRPLAGFEKPWSKSGTGWEDKFFKGKNQVWIDYEGKGKDIRNLTTLIEKSKYADDVWVQSGQGYGTLGSFLNIDKSTIMNMSEKELQQFVGVTHELPQFVSAGVCKGGGFAHKDVIFNIYCPQGSEMLYASNAGHFGKSEQEIILQRGGTYEIRKIYKGNGKVYVDMDLRSDLGYDKFQQNPLEWKGDTTHNYKNS